MEDGKMITVEKRETFRRNLSWLALVGGSLAISLQSLKELTKKYAFSVAAGDIQLLDGRCYVTHAGLLRLPSDVVAWN